MVNQIIHDMTGDILFNFYSINYIMDFKKKSRIDNR